MPGRVSKAKRRAREAVKEYEREALLKKDMSIWDYFQSVKAVEDLGEGRKIRAVKEALAEVARMRTEKYLEACTIAIQKGEELPKRVLMYEDTILPNNQVIRKAIGYRLKTPDEIENDERLARISSEPTELPPDESPIDDGDSIRPGGSICFAIPDRISDGGDTEESRTTATTSLS